MEHNFLPPDLPAQVPSLAAAIAMSSCAYAYSIFSDHPMMEKPPMLSIPSSTARTESGEVNGSSQNPNSYLTTAPTNGQITRVSQSSLVPHGSAAAEDKKAKIFPCEICGKKFSQKGNLKNHMFCHSKIKPFNCEVCGKGFTQKSTMDYHRSIHQGLKPFACEMCGKSFTQKGNLKTHLISHSGTKPYSCEICGRGFAQRGNMKTHLRTHYGEKPFECEVCGKRFTLKGNLNTHILSHKGIKPFSCEICGKTFAQKLSMEYHMNSHTGNKPYKCAVCGKSFTQKGNMKTHMRSHSGEKHHACQICGKCFTQKGNMKTHMKLHCRPPDVDKPYQCAICCKSFVTRSSLECHMANHVNRGITGVNKAAISAQQGHPSPTLSVNRRGRPPNDLSLKQLNEHLAKQANDLSMRQMNEAPVYKQEAPDHSEKQNEHAIRQMSDGAICKTENTVSLRTINDHLLKAGNASFTKPNDPFIKQGNELLGRALNDHFNRSGNEALYRSLHEHMGRPGHDFLSRSLNGHLGRLGNETLNRHVNEHLERSLGGQLGRLGNNYLGGGPSSEAMTRLNNEQILRQNEQMRRHVNEEMLRQNNEHIARSNSEHLNRSSNDHIGRRNDNGDHIGRTTDNIGRANDHNDNTVRANDHNDHGVRSNDHCDHWSERISRHMDDHLGHPAELMVSPSHDHSHHDHFGNARNEHFVERVRNEHIDSVGQHMVTVNKDRFSRPDHHGRSELMNSPHNEHLVRPGSSHHVMAENEVCTNGGDHLDRPSHNPSVSRSDMVRGNHDHFGNARSEHFVERVRNEHIDSVGERMVNVNKDRFSRPDHHGGSELMNSPHNEHLVRPGSSHLVMAENEVCTNGGDHLDRPSRNPSVSRSDMVSPNHDHFGNARNEHFVERVRNEHIDSVGERMVTVNKDRFSRPDHHGGSELMNSPHNEHLVRPASAHLVMAENEVCTNGGDHLDQPSRNPSVDPSVNENMSETENELLRTQENELPMQLTQN